MSHLFIAIYNFIKKRPLLFYITLFLFLGITYFLVSGLKIEEDIRKIIPQDVRISKINQVLNNSSFADKLIFNISSSTPSETTPEALISAVEPLVQKLKSTPSYIKTVQFKVQQNTFKEIYSFIYQNLPLFLTDKHYSEIEKRLTADEIDRTLEKSFKTLISPSGFALKTFIFKDPLNITPLALKKLEKFRLDSNFDIYNSVVFTKDRKHLLIFIEPVFSSSETGKNKTLIEFLDKAIHEFKLNNSSLNIEYYGGTAVAVANANRMKSDIILTVSAAMGFLFTFFILFFRNLKVLFLLFLPVILGAGLSLSILSVFSGEISAVALAVGAVLLGISVDYSLHAFTHFRSEGSVTKTLKDISEPILMSSLTTASAFLCLFIVRSQALQQLGMFAAFSVVSAAFFVLTVLPFFLTKHRSPQKQVTRKKTILDRFSNYPFEKNKPLLFIILVLTALFAFTSRQIGFNSDIASLNYLPPHLQQAEENLKSISSETMSAVYLVTTGKTFLDALRVTEQKMEILNQEKKKYSVSTTADLIFSPEKQSQKILKWNQFWEKVDKRRVKSLLVEKGKKHHFKGAAFTAFYQLLDREFQPIPTEEFRIFKTLFLKDYLHESEKGVSITSILKVDADSKAALFKKLSDEQNTVIFDRQYFTNQFFKVLSEDFDKLVFLSITITFGILLLFYGRIELAIVTFVPIILSWIWTLGLMGVFGIKFNILNIIISTFIFGLGIDYSIFVMRGLLNQHKYGNSSLASYKLSILLSSITTVVGIGVLIFAKHPALKSIAAVSIFGILSVVLISYTILPLIFSILIRSKGKRRVEPVTFLNFVISIVTLAIFLFGTLSLIIIIPLLILLPLPRRWVKYLFHLLFMGTCRFIVGINFTIKKEYINRESLDFKKPTIFIANHQSFLDLVLLLLLHPKMIALTNEWVWKHPILGVVVKFAEYYPVFKGMDGGYAPIRKKVEEGYSILIFPEGTRSIDGSIKRFHQGAFKLADELGLDLQPVLIHGANHCAPKSEFFLRSGHITIKFFDRIKVQPITAENATYTPQAKAVTQFFRDQYEQLRSQKENPNYFLKRLLNQYVYKGPVLEWYVKIKLRLEKNFCYFNSIIPANCSITDIGCGYGYLGFMLHAVAPKRNILGIDYDEEKIQVAQNIAASYPNLNYRYANITKEDLPESDIFIITDVLHYLPEDLQEMVLKQCMKKVSKKGMIILRDADADLTARTKITQHTELHSTKLTKFNKTEYDLSFVSGKKIEQIAEAGGFNFKRVDNAKYTANITYILTPKTV